MITIQEYQKRRQQLACQLPPDSVAVIPAAVEAVRNGDAHYRFRQDSDFYYLTGFNEPDALLLITSGSQSESVLFNRPCDPLAEQWTGKRLGQKDAVEVLGVTDAFSIAECDKRLSDYLSGRQAVFYAVGKHPEWEKRVHRAWARVKELVRRGVKAPELLGDLSPLMSEMRLIKSPAEMELMRKAAAISIAAHQRAMSACSKLNYEYELEAELLYELVRSGCRSVAYDPIVACGENACILHYTENNQPLKPGELVLIDAGGEFDNYAADITRTFPVNGRFTSEQKAVYELVLNAQKAGIAKVQPGTPWNSIQEVIVQELTYGLVHLGLLQGRVDDLIEQEAYKVFYMHGSGHWLGLDVHDSGFYKINQQWRALTPGMALTVEPGVYIDKRLSHVDPRWLGIGIRIEDDILVTESGCENLTGALAVEMTDIEAIVRD